MAEAEKGEIKIEGMNREYWNSKKNPVKKGDQVKGVLLRAEAGEYPEGSGTVTTNYILQGDNGEIVLPNHVVLNGMMSRVQVNKTARVVYLGKSDKQSRGRNAPELYDVFVSTQTNLTEQGQLPKTDAPAMADYMKKILDKLTFADKCMPDGIPANIFTEIVEAELKAARITDNGAFNRVVEALKGTGAIFEPKTGFFKVVVA